MAVGTHANGEWRSFSLSALAHLVLLVALAMNFSLWPSQNNRPVRLAIDAMVVMDDKPQRARQDALERAKEEEARKRQAEERERETQLERERVEADRRRQEQEAVQQAEEKRRREAAEQAEAKRQAAEEKRRAAEAAAAERAKEQAKQREREVELERQKAAEARRRAEQEAELLAQLAAEEERENAVAAGLLDQWVEVIRQRVTRNWVRPASATAGLQCEVRVNQIPGGEVVDVTVGRCNGDAAVIRSIENAVLRASPLPPPPDPSLFERRIIFDFKPED